MKFLAPTILGTFAAVASAGAIDKRYWETVSVFCAEKTVTQTVYATAPGGGAPVTAVAPAPPSSSVWTSGGYVTSVQYDTTSASRYTTVDVYPTGTGKKDCTRAVYHESTQITVEIIVIIEIIIDNKPTYSTESTKSGSPTWTPPPITYTPPSDASTTYTGLPYTTGVSSAAPPSGTGKVTDVELRNDNGVFHYVPNSVNANVGDVINFKFFPKAHSVTQSEFKTPCTFNGGFDTGLLNGTADGSVSRQFTVTDVSKPLWFYCKATAPVNHCGVGMVFGINPGDKMDQFIANAIAQNGNRTTSANSTSTATGTATATGSSSTTTSGAQATTTVVVSGGLNRTINANTLKYDPPFLPRAAAGDLIVFDFRKLNHTATESTFDNPCTKKSADVFDTNFNDFNPQDVPGSKLERFTVPDNEPHYFYCKQANKTPNGHCSNGMVFAINIDQARFDAFKANAEKTLPQA